ncbi:hypothetical protein LEMLEM_LOCUS18984 [Lemmus lemmus]
MAMMPVETKTPRFRMAKQERPYSGRGSRLDAKILLQSQLT